MGVILDMALNKNYIKFISNYFIILDMNFNEDQIKLLDGLYRDPKLGL